MSKTVYIYGLFDPRNDQIFYVGSAVNLKARLSAHHTCHFTGKALKAVLLDIEAQGMRADIRPLEETTHDLRDERESYWIAKCRAEGVQLTNAGVPSNTKQMAGRERRYQMYIRRGTL